jgi:protein-S-isoprenylcysteine O-methyltransferase Ste14
MYLAMLISFFGIGIACASWLFLLLMLVLMIVMITQVSGEEHSCLALYGEQYRQYLDRTPRWLGIPK